MEGGEGGREGGDGGRGGREGGREGKERTEGKGDNGKCLYTVYSLR